MLEDEWLKWKFRRGSREALARIYEKYLDSLLTLAMGLLNDASEAQDIVHDVFVSFAKSAPSFGLRGSLSGYLATSVVNRVRDHRRRRRRQALGRDAEPHILAHAPEPDQMVVFNEEAARLNEAVAQLPDDQREVVILRLTAGMKFQDIAKLQQVSTNTVQGRYRYGLSRLRTLVNGEVET
jgi:RNA polymerase sigma-70 factor (ECF subfamily)